MGDHGAAERAGEAAAAALDGVRDQVRSLLSLLHTGVKPPPDGVVPASGRNPGPVWRPVRDWSVRAIEEDGQPRPMVYLSSPEHFGGDFSAAFTDEGRALAMAILAACDWAEGARQPGRYPELGEDERDSPSGRFVLVRAEHADSSPGVRTDG